MARQAINIGSSANDGTGDPLRTAFDKINDNFVELYGTDNDINTLDANLNVNTFAITTGVTNGDITVTPNGTGNINLGSITVNGSQISSNDSTQITLADNIQTTGTMNVTGAATLATSLTLATGATVTGILDEDNLGTDSATQLATQQSIKAYVDAQVTAQDLDFACDDSTTLSIDLDSESLQFSGGTGITTAGTANTVTIAIDGTVTTLTGSQTLTNKVLTSPTINAATMTGTVTVDSISMADNTITTNASNADLELDASGTGSVRLIAPTTAVSTLTTADITTTGTHTITGQLDAEGVRIKDNTISTNASNANLEVSANGTGIIDIKDAMTTVGQTITGDVVIDGQFDIDNISINGNGIIATNSNGGILINPNGTGMITLGGSTVTVPSILSAHTVFIDRELLMGPIAKIKPQSTNDDVVIEANGTGSVVLEEVSITGNKITTHNSNADLQIDTDGTGTIELQTTTNVTGNLTVSGAFTGSRQTISGAGAINLTTLFTEITTTGADAFSLANGTVGQIKIITMAVDGGDATITPTTFANGTSITMDAVHSSVTLIYGANGWLALASQNITINA
jgi:trimeric autotransporter adhesin